MIKSDQSGLYQNYDMDKVFIKNLQVETIIGIFEWEREVRQVVSIDLEMEFDNKKAAKSDDIKDVQTNDNEDSLSKETNEKLATNNLEAESKNIKKQVIITLE